MRIPTFGAKVPAAAAISAGALLAIALPGEAQVSADSPSVGAFRIESPATLQARGAAFAALVDLGVRSVRCVVREPNRVAAARSCAERLGLRLDVLRWADVEFAMLARRAAVLVNTAPAAAIAAEVDALAEAGCVLDVIYHPWPTALALAVERRGGRLATGLDMLLHQAFVQVELFTGRPAPRLAMRDALRAATGEILELPVESLTG